MTAKCATFWQRCNFFWTTINIRSHLSGADSSLKVRNRLQGPAVLGEILFSWIAPSTKNTILQFKRGNEGRNEHGVKCRSLHPVVSFWLELYFVDRKVLRSPTGNVAEYCKSDAGGICWFPLWKGVRMKLLLPNSRESFIFYSPCCGCAERSHPLLHVAQVGSEERFCPLN